MSLFLFGNPDVFNSKKEGTFFYFLTMFAKSFLPLSNHIDGPDGLLVPSQTGTERIQNGPFGTTDSVLIREKVGQLKSSLIKEHDEAKTIYVYSFLDFGWVAQHVHVHIYVGSHLQNARALLTGTEPNHHAGIGST